jgi:hypothetical protein
MPPPNLLNPIRMRFHALHQTPPPQRYNHLKNL